MPSRRIKMLLIVALALVLALSGAALFYQAPRAEAEPGRLRVLASSFAAYDFARQVAGADAEVTLLIPPGTDIHGFDPAPKDLIALEGCDLFIYTGGESDAWIEDLLPLLDTKDVSFLRLLDCVTPLQEDDSVLVAGAGADKSTGFGEGIAAYTNVGANSRQSAITSVVTASAPAATSAPAAANPPELDEHVWTSPRNALMIVRELSSTLIQHDPAHAEGYRQRTAAYLAELEQLDADFRTVIAQGTRTTLVFGDRFPFRYLAEEYGLTCYAAFPGCSAASEPDAKTLAALIERVRGEGLPVVFYVELSNPTIATTIAEATGAQALELQSCHTVTRADFDAGASYISLMRANLAALKVALS